MIAADIFSGCGGMTVGLKDAGFDVIFAIEIDINAANSYQMNHDEVFMFRKDINHLHGSEIFNKTKLEEGELDLLAGCPPCQGFSTLRTLNGKNVIDEPRNELLLEFLRLIEDLKPKTVMLENVPGLKSETIFEVFCARLRVLGYKVESRVLDAAEFGVPQRRKRLILLAGLFGSIDFATPSSNLITVRDAIGSLPYVGKSGDPLHDISTKRSARIKKLIARIPKDGGSRTDLGEEDQLDCHKKCGGFKDVYGRMAWDKVSPTLTGGCINPSKGRFLHPKANRAISLREAALLQSFPVDYLISLARGKYAAAELIGNALPPEFIRQHATKVADYISSNSAQTQEGGNFGKSNQC